MNFLNKANIVLLTFSSLSLIFFAQEVPTNATPDYVQDMSGQQLENVVEKAQRQGVMQRQIEFKARAGGLFREAKCLLNDLSGEVDSRPGWSKNIE